MGTATLGYGHILRGFIRGAGLASVGVNHNHIVHLRYMDSENVIHTLAETPLPETPEELTHWARAVLTLHVST